MKDVMHNFVVQSKDKRYLLEHKSSGKIMEVDCFFHISNITISVCSNPQERFLWEICHSPLWLTSKLWLHNHSVLLWYLAHYFGYSKYFLARKVIALLTPLPFRMTSVKWSSKIAVSRCPFYLVLSFPVKNTVLAFTSIAESLSNSSTSMTNKVISQVSLPNAQDWPEGYLWERLSSCNGSWVPICL